MKLWMQPLGPIQTNGYVLSNKGKGVVIDPGMNPEPMLDYIQDLHIEAILLTHAHFDHIGGLEAVRKQTGAPVYIHQSEDEWLTEPTLNGSAWWEMMTEPIKCQPRDGELKDGQTIHFAGIDLLVLHTPGHSPGSVSFYNQEEEMIIAGDTLFAGSIGRTDLPGGDYDTLMGSIQKKILTLPEQTKVYPGHGPETIIANEIKMNPFLQG